MLTWGAAVMLAMSLGACDGGSLCDCGALLARIDHFLTRAKLTPAFAARINELRQEGARLHQAGRYPECMAPLTEAAVLLGLEKRKS